MLDTSMGHGFERIESWNLKPQRLLLAPLVWVLNFGVERLDWIENLPSVPPCIGILHTWHIFFPPKTLLLFSPIALRLACTHPQHHHLVLLHSLNTSVLLATRPPNTQCVYHFWMHRVFVCLNVSLTTCFPISFSPTLEFWREKSPYFKPVMSGRKKQKVDAEDADGE